MTVRYELNGQAHDFSGMIPGLESPPQTLPAHLVQKRPVATLGPSTVTAPTRPPALTISPPDKWNDYLLHILEGIAPTDQNQEVLLDILMENELVVYRDHQDVLQTSLPAAKPDRVEVVDVMPLTALLPNPAAAAQLRIPDPSTPRSQILFEIGSRDSQSYPLVLIDFHSGRAYFVQILDKDEEAELTRSAQGGLPVHAATSQIKAYLGQPIHSITRLIASISTTTADIFTPTPQWMFEGEEVPPVLTRPGMDLDSWETQLDQITGHSASLGQVRYLVDGEGFFPRLIHLINTAQQSVRLRLYIFDNDDYAIGIADQLKSRSNDISVQLLLDGLGTVAAGSAAPGYYGRKDFEYPTSVIHYLKAGSNINLRTVANPWFQGDHTKSLIFDDKTVLLGGMNIGREYRYEWHDLMIETTGPVVDEINRDFDRAWNKAGIFGDLQAITQRPRQYQTKSVQGDYPIRVLYTRPGDSQILRTQIAAIRNAQQRIWIQNAYITSDTILYEIIKARRRGVDVRVILPYENDSGIIDRSNALAANTLLRNGVRVYIYPGMSHLKAAIYDGWACFGSANFDRLSLRLNQEMNLATSHPAAVTDLVEQVFEPDFSRSVELEEPLPTRWYDHLMEMIADHL
ncbi:MAG: phospholipase D-like domain-containing protein [bacterium]